MEAAAAPGAPRGRGRGADAGGVRRLLRDPLARLPARRLGVARSPRRSRTASGSRRASPRSTRSTRARSRARRTGAGSACCRRRSSSGRAARTACHDRERASRARPTAPGARPRAVLIARSGVSDARPGRRRSSRRRSARVAAPRVTRRRSRSSSPASYGAARVRVGDQRQLGDRADARSSSSSTYSGAVQLTPTAATCGDERRRAPRPRSRSPCPVRSPSRHVNVTQQSMSSSERDDRRRLVRRGWVSIAEEVRLGLEQQRAGGARASRPARRRRRCTPARPPATRRTARPSRRRARPPGARSARSPPAARPAPGSSR